MRNVLLVGLFASISVSVWACGDDDATPGGVTPGVDGGTSSGGTSGGDGGSSGATSSSSGTPATANAGKADPAFGEAGIAKMQPQSEMWTPSGGIVMADGRVIMVGVGNDPIGKRDVVIGRLTVDGKPDAENGANPSVKLGRPGSPDNIEAPVLTQEIAGGALLFMGRATVTSAEQGFVEMHRLTDYKCSATFGENFCYRAPNSTYFERPVAIGAAAFDAAGNVIVGGTGPVGGKDFVVQKLKAADGFPDNAFGDQVQGVGLATADLGGDEGIGHIELEADGSITAFGVTSAAANPGVVVVKLSAAGVVGTKTPLNVPAERYAKTPDGKIVVAAKVGGKTVFARMLKTGELDTTFGTGGKATADFTPNAVSTITGLAVLGDGRIVVGYNDFTVGRFTANGALDPSWNGNGFAVGGVPAGVELFAVGVQSGDRVVGIGGRGKAGDTGTDSDLAMFAVRFQN